MKIKDLPPNMSLEGTRVLIPEQHRRFAVAAGLTPPFEVYLRSSWNKGVWVRKTPTDSRMYPVSLENPSEVLEWDVVESA